MPEQNVGGSITVSLPVRLDEIDYLGIVHASNYLKYMEHARVKLIEQQGIDWLAWVKKGVSSRSCERYSQLSASC